MFSFSPVVSFQLIALFSILALTVISAYLPLRLHYVASSTREKTLAFFSFFTAGVFLGAGLCHLLPDALASAALPSAPAWLSAEFPTIYFLCALGFTAIWAVDRIKLGGDDDSHRVIKKQDMLAISTAALPTQEEVQDGSVGGASICYVQVQPVTTYNRKSSSVRSPLARDPPSRTRTTSEPSHAHAHHHHTKSTSCDEASYQHSVTVDDSCAEDGHSHGGHSHSHSYASTADHDSMHATDSPSQSSHQHPDDAVTTEPTSPTLHDHKHDSVHHHHIVIPGDSILLPLALTIIFSIHSFIEGIALGVQTAVSHTLISVLIAILAHKTVEALTVGSNFVKQRVSIRRAIPILAVYSLMTPLGIVVGILMQSAHGQSGLSCVTQAFASGSFLYLAVHELNDDNCCQHVSPSIQVALVLVGLVFMALIAVVA